MSLSLTSRARVLAGSERRSAKEIGSRTALKVVCIQLQLRLSVVGVDDFSLFIEGVIEVWLARVTDSIRGTIFPVNVPSCEVSAIVSSPSYCP